MATINWPTGRAFIPRALEVQLRPQVRMSESIYTGQVTSFETPFSAWWFTLTLTAQRPADRAEVEAFLHTIRGPANRVTMWHHMRPTPRGTLSGTVTVQSTGVVAGASAITLQGAGVGTTLRAGDMLSINGMLVQVTGDATANGSGLITVNFAPQLRGAAPAGSAVVYVRPTALFILREAPTIGYVPGEAVPITLTFSEVFA